MIAVSASAGPKWGTIPSALLGEFILRGVFLVSI